MVVAVGIGREQGPDIRAAVEELPAEAEVRHRMGVEVYESPQSPRALLWAQDMLMVRRIIDHEGGQALGEPLERLARGPHQLAIADAIITQHHVDALHVPVVGGLAEFVVRLEADLDVLDGARGPGWLQFE